MKEENKLNNNAGVQPLAVGIGDVSPLAPNKLLSCPFCGGNASFGSIRLSSPSPITNKDGSNRNDSFFVSCQHCQANNNGIVHGYQTGDEAATAWNTRAT